MNDGSDSPPDGCIARARPNPLRATVNCVTTLSATALIFVMMLLHSACSRSTTQRHTRAMGWTHRWCKACCRLAGIRVRREGPEPPDGCLLAPNHSGYLDVWALGAVSPCFFVAKADVLRWPLFGTVFRYSRQISVCRERIRTLTATNAQIASRLTDGQNVCVFLEGTSSGNDRLLPFRPPLAQAALDADAPVVPVAICWQATRPGTRVADDVAYWGGHVIVPHLLRVLGLTGIEAHIIFGSPIPSAGHTRASLAASVQDAVAALSGLPVETP